MKINDFSEDEVMLRTTASMLAQKFTQLQRIGDSATYDVFNLAIPEEDLVRIFWPYLGQALHDDGGNGICRADIGYATVDGSDPTEHPDRIHSTQITLTRINDKQHREILEENEARKKLAGL